MGFILALYAVLVCTETLLSSDKLTPLVTAVANRMLNAEIAIGRIELTAKSSYPFLKLEVDRLCVVNPTIRDLKNDTTRHLPVYSDTLLSISHFVGELNLPKLFAGTIDINNVDIVGPEINIVIVNDSINNFDIIKPSVDDDETGSHIPDIRLKRFSISGAKEFRFYNAITDMSAGINIRTLLERHESKPVYALTFTGDLAGKMLQEYNIVHLPLTLDGEIEWMAASPYSIKLHDFRLGTTWLYADLNLETDFAEELIINNLSVTSNNINVTDLLQIVPDSIIQKAELQNLRTDASLSLSLRLDSAFNFDRDSIPYATISVSVDPCHITYGRARIERFATDIIARLNGNDPDCATVDIEKLDIAGPATSLKINGGLRTLISDPEFDVTVNGHTSLSKLPPPIMRNIEGYISGNITADIRAMGRSSMFERNEFHKLRVEGDIDLSRFYWVSPDTNSMAFVNEGCLKFDTNHTFKGLDKLLAASFKTDSANILTGGINLIIKDLSIGIGAQNLGKQTDTTIVVPMGGGIKIKTLNVTSITDSAGARFRDVGGSVAIKRYNDLKRVPEFLFNLEIGRMAAGSRDARMLFSNSRLNFNAHKIPAKKSEKALRKSIDSISKSRPDLPPDSVYILALAHRRQHRSKHHRVHAEMTDSSTEIIDWGTSKGLRRLLIDWKLNGTLTTKRASLFTPHFPLRNRLTDLNITFNNDTIAIHRLAYKVGSSDFLADGRISNLKGALTARKRLSPLKLELDVASDTVDVNQLAEAFFRGASYKRHSSDTDDLLKSIDDDTLFERELSGDAAHTTDSMAPVLIPANIEADVTVRAKNILYSDLMLNNMTGNVLVYDGAVNLHQLKANSDVASVDLSALYSAPTPDEMRFGFGLKVNQFDIARFVSLVPAIDSIMPLLRDISGIIDADIAATVDINSDMNLDLPTLTAAVRLQGDSLRLLDAESFRTIAKWLLFKDKQRNIIDHMNVELTIADNQMQLYPFIFDIDRYKIGVQGHNDLALNFNYRISVLKSPLPFKFGITIKGNPEHYKIRLGKARFNEKEAVERQISVDTTRVNLIDQIENVFRRGVRRSRFAKLSLPKNSSIAADINLEDEPVTASDSLLFIREGLIPAPAVPVDTVTTKTNKK